MKKKKDSNLTNMLKEANISIDKTFNSDDPDGEREEKELDDIEKAIEKVLKKQDPTYKGNLCWQLIVIADCSNPDDDWDVRVSTTIRGKTSVPRSDVACFNKALQHSAQEMSEVAFNQGGLTQAIINQSRKGMSYTQKSGLADLLQKFKED